MLSRYIFKVPNIKSSGAVSFARTVRLRLLRSSFCSNINRKTVTISGREQQIFETLDKVVKDFNLNTEVRVAGGWVRNKLMGLAGGDIDIALTNISGLEFAEHLKKSLKLGGHEKQANENDIESYLIKANPEQSKHLETAAVYLQGMWIDFVNMRSEVYFDESGRIPKMSFATPREDANRRDFTVNSLFYNIHSGEVEDFTSVGLDDIRNNVLESLCWTCDCSKYFLVIINSKCPH